MNTLLPALRGANCKGSAIKFPWASCPGWGKSDHRNQADLMPALHGSREITQPSLRAVIADSPRSKKIQIWPPSGARTLQAAGTLKSGMSQGMPGVILHVLLSKSAARKRHVVGEEGYKRQFLPRGGSRLRRRSADELPRLPVTSSALRAASVDRLPIRHDRRHVSVSAITFSHRRAYTSSLRETGFETV